MSKKMRFISLLLCVFLFVANIDVIYAKAAPLKESEAAQIAKSIERSYTGEGKASTKYFNQLANGELTFLSTFTITDLDAPKHGQMLDSIATVISDNGLSWEIPVLWVNREGDLVKIAIEINDEVRSYPIFVFYLPDGYSLMFGDNTSFNISMPDFVCRLINTNGVATLSNPNRGITYITPMLPGHSKLVANTPTGYYETSSEGSDSENVVPYDFPGEEGDDCPSTPSGSRQQYRDYNPDINEEEAKQIAEQHSDQNAIDELGEDNIAWFVSYIKDIIEPEAVNILLQKFPAYKAAADSGELGKDLGCYIYYDDVDLAIASIGWNLDDDDLGYKLSANGYYFYKYDSYSGTTKTDVDFDDDANIYLDRTMVHEVMHVMMDDYTRAGMTGLMYDESDGEINWGNDNRFPKWFIEGIATAVGSPYQHWVFSFRRYYDYYTDKSYNSDTIKYIYENDSTMHLSYSDGGVSDTRVASYMNGWLATVYLGALASKTYDGNVAMADKEDDTATFNSQYVLNGLNHILEELHSGKSLDNVIREISTDGTNNIIYDGTDDFTDKFIATTNNAIGDDDEASLEFCTKFLNYLETVSDDANETYANGSVLVDFTDTTELLLSADLLKNMPEVYVLADTSDYTKSTADEKTAYASGGKHEDGVIEDPNATSGINGTAVAASEVANIEEGMPIADITAKEYFEEENKKEAPATEIIIVTAQDDCNSCELSTEEDLVKADTKKIDEGKQPLSDGTFISDDDVDESNPLISSLTEAIDVGIEKSKEEKAEEAEESLQPMPEQTEETEQAKEPETTVDEAPVVEVAKSIDSNDSQSDQQDESKGSNDENSNDEDSGRHDEREEDASQNKVVAKPDEVSESASTETSNNQDQASNERSEEGKDEIVENALHENDDASSFEKSEEVVKEDTESVIDDNTDSGEHIMEDIVIPETIIISETESSESNDDGSDNTSEEQILDAIPETGTHEEEESGSVVPLITH